MDFISTKQKTTSKVLAEDRLVTHPPLPSNRGNFLRPTWGPWVASTLIPDDSFSYRRCWSLNPRRPCPIPRPGRMFQGPWPLHGAARTLGSMRLPWWRGPHGRRQERVDPMGPFIDWLIDLFVYLFIRGSLVFLWYDFWIRHLFILKSFVRAGSVENIREGEGIENKILSPVRNSVKEDA